MVMTAIRKNPYIIGCPVNADRFFNREKLLEFVADNLNQGTKSILIYGQRRIGKSSILAELPHALSNEPFTFISLSLEGKSQKNLPEVLHELAKETLFSLEDTDWVPLVPSIAELEAEPEIFVTQFLKQIHKICNQRDLVLLLDEFDTLGDYHPESAENHLFPYLQEFISAPGHHYNFLRIVPVIGRRLEDIPTLKRVFHNAPMWEIRLLDRTSAQQLITEPARGILTYSQEAIEALFDLCAGHPYFTQIMGFALFSQARSCDRWTVEAIDVAAVVDRAIELGGGGLAWFWDGLPIAERVVYAAAAEIAAKSSTGVEVRDGEPLELLEDRGIVLTDCLHKAQTKLIEWKFLDRITSRPETVLKGTYRITIELVRRWLVRQHSIRDEVWELQDLEPDLKPLYEAACHARNQGKLPQAIHIYEQVFAGNPNHLGALFDLADCCLHTHAYGRALELFDRAYAVDPVRARDGLLRSGLGYAKILRDEYLMTEARNILDHLLDMGADREQIRQMLAEIQQMEDQKIQPKQSWGRFIPEWKWKLSEDEDQDSSQKREE
jgi:tetratricopeptide (TPR) repeat protein